MYSEAIVPADHPYVYNFRMGRQLSHRALVPSIHITESIISELETAAKQASLPKSPDSGVLIGHCDYSGPSPHITFSKFNQYGNSDSESEIAASSADEILGFVLFQEQPDIDWDRCLKNYIEANQSTDGYTCSYYYQPVFTASYRNSLSVHCYLLTPDLSVSITKIADGAKNADAKKRPGYATYTNTREQVKFVDTTFLGVVNAEDPRILALCYSLSLVYENKPIHALIGTSQYKLEATLAEDHLCYEGDGRLEKGAIAFLLKVQGVAEPEAGDEAEPEKQKLNVDVVNKLAELREKINELRERCDRQKGIREAFERQESETQKVLQKILEAMSARPQLDSQKVGRFAPPRNLATPKRQQGAMSIQMSQIWEAPEPETAVAVVKETVPVSQVRPTKRSAQVETPKPVEHVWQDRLGIDAPAIPPMVAKVAQQLPKGARLPALSDPSFCIEDYSKLDDMRTFFDRIGLNA
jgi:hypothetical protein